MYQHASPPSPRAHDAHHSLPPSLPPFTLTATHKRGEPSLPPPLHPTQAKMFVTTSIPSSSSSAASRQRMQQTLKTVSSGSSSGGARRGTSTSSNGGGGGGGGGPSLTPPFPTWEEMVPAWDPQALVGVEAQTPPLDSAGPVVTVSALVDALTALQRRQQQQQQQQQHGDGEDEEDPFPDFLNEGLRSRSSSVSSSSSPSCGAATAAAAAAAAAATAAAAVDSVAVPAPAEGGTLTPNMFERSSSFMSLLPISPFGRGLSEEEEGEEGMEGAEEADVSRQGPALALDTNTMIAATITQERGFLPSLPPSLPPHVFVTFLDTTTTSSASTPSSLPPSPRNLKLFFGPLASDPSLWAAWGLPAHAFPSFSAAVNDAPSSLDAHLAALLPSLPALALSFYNGGGRGGGLVLLLTLPSLSLRPATSLEVLVATPTASSTPSSLPPSLLDLLRARALPPSFWREYFSLSSPAHEAALQEAGREGGTEGGLAVVYDFLLSYLLSPSSSSSSSSSSSISPTTTKHWTEEALVNGLRIVLHPALPPAFPSRGFSLQSLPPLVAEEEGREGGREEGVEFGHFDFDEANLEGLFERGVLEEDVSSLPPSSSFPHVGGKRLASLMLARGGGGGGGGEGGREEGEEGVRRSGRARRVKYTYSEADEEEEDEVGMEEVLTKPSRPITTSYIRPPLPPSSSSSTLLPYHYPGRPAPVGKELLDRGRHKCRVPGCTDDYRWPDYKCKAHGGGRCQFMWWRREAGGEERGEACLKFHQSRNSRGELLCGEHCRLTGAVYGEVSRRGGAKAGGAGGAKKGKRTVKKKVWA